MATETNKYIYTHIKSDQKLSGSLTAAVNPEAEKAKQKLPWTGEGGTATQGDTPGFIIIVPV